MPYRFERKSTEDLRELTITTATDQFGLGWSFISTADGEDRIITPQGDVIDASGWAPALDGPAAEFLQAVVDWSNE